MAYFKNRDSNYNHLCDKQYYLIINLHSTIKRIAKAGFKNETITYIHVCTHNIYASSHLSCPQNCANMIKWISAVICKAKDNTHLTSALLWDIIAANSSMVIISCYIHIWEACVWTPWQHTAMWQNHKTEWKSWPTRLISSALKSSDKNAVRVRTSLRLFSGIWSNLVPIRSKGTGFSANCSLS